MISDDANASPLQPDGLADLTETTTDRDERLASTRPAADAADGEDHDSTANMPPESQISPQPAPGLCGVCGQAHWELYAHLPIETDAYLAAVADLNRRSRLDKRKRSKPSRTSEAHQDVAPIAAEGLPQDASDQNASDSQGNNVASTAHPSTEPDATSQRENQQENQQEHHREERDDPSGKPELEAEPGFDERDARPNLAEFPHGTAWRCYDCEALSLVWPIESEPIAETVEQPARRRSSAEFRDGIKAQIENCLRAKATGSRAAVTLKSLRVLDLNLGRGTRADRNLALLHELGLAKHQIFGIGDDANTVDCLNFAGYQAYCGTIDRVLGELPDGYFHLVLGFNVIEYLPNPSATIHQLTAKLRPSARLLLSYRTRKAGRRGYFVTVTGRPISAIGVSYWVKKPCAFWGSAAISRSMRSKPILNPKPGRPHQPPGRDANVIR